jgi:hypothetical protein
LVRIQECIGKTDIKEAWFVAGGLLSLSIRYSLLTVTVNVELAANMEGISIVNVPGTADGWN